MCWIVRLLCGVIAVGLPSATFGQAGDFNGDGDLDCSDVDTLTQAIASGSGNPTIFDLNRDGQVNRDDLTVWLGLGGEANLGPGESFVYGDGNLDGSVDASDTDLIQSFRFTLTSAYCSGNFNADGVVDAHDNQVAYSNLFTSYETVDGAGSLGTAVPGKSDYYYDPASGKMWMETGGDRFNAWAIPAPPASSIDELGMPFDFSTFFSQAYFNSQEQWLSRPSMVTGVFQIATYPTGLTGGDFGAVEAATVLHAFYEPVPWHPTDARLSNVTVATIKMWQGGDGMWNSGNWQGAAIPPSANEIAIFDFGTGAVTIDSHELAESVEALVRDGRLTIDGTHVGDVTVFSSNYAPVSHAQLSGGGALDGDLVLMGSLTLRGVETLQITGQAILSAGYSAFSAERSGFARIELDDTFTLTPGTSTGEFAVLAAAGGIDGVFRGLEIGSRFGPIFVESLTYTATEVLLDLAADLPGDANRDGAVDVSDFNIWNENKFQSSTDWFTGDFNGDGTTDVADFNIWNQNKFTSIDTQVVPEPSSAWCLFAAWVFAGALELQRGHNKNENRI